MRAESALHARRWVAGRPGGASRRSLILVSSQDEGRGRWAYSGGPGCVAQRAFSSPSMIGVATLTIRVKTRKPIEKIPAETKSSVREGK